MLIDFHTHCFPDKIAAGAIENLSYRSGGLEPQHNGTLSGLKQKMSEYGVDISVVQNIATNSKQQMNVNNFANEINKIDGIIAFGSVYPDAPDALCELDRIKEMGIKGIKLHPEYQNFKVDDEKMKPIYKRISELGLVVLFHAGQDYGFAPPYRCMPENLQNALKWLDTTVVAAHWGGCGCGLEVQKYLCGLDLYFDTSFGYGAAPRDILKGIIEKHGTDKILFGTDMPWHNPEMEKRVLNTMELTDEDKDKIYFKNAQKILGI